ncbi:hypothetical protein NLU13_8318 [Sarocladium strictum]|uniref:Zn(2)-C6 fungal-type domain-containing protein n=1 Tax=Sarocladium strictum TaxID=5046 RepID=A0AA39L515_SARSR|nr:hypothetical protein NLU13_8318 [Sarocladium strictum]
MPVTSTAKKFSKRAEYTSHACVECQRRKVKCSGLSPCHNCLGRGAECSYQALSNGPGKRKRKQSSSSPNTNKRRAPLRSPMPSSASEETALLKDQLGRLQEGLDTLVRQQTLGIDFLNAHTTLSLPDSTNDSAILPDARPATFSQRFESSRPQNPVCNIETESLSSSQESQKSLEPAHCETDTFVPGLKWPNRFAVASQICDLRSSVGENPLLADATPTSSSYSVVLPPPRDLAQAIKVGLAAFDCLLPVIYRKTLVERISRTLQELGYPSVGQSIVVEESHHMVVSVLLIVISAGKLLRDQAGIDASPENAWSGSDSYWQSRRLVQHFEGGCEVQASCVTYHTMAAAYLLSAERLRLASSHILNGLYAAVSLGLGQIHSFTASAEDLADPLGLWVTLDFLDKRITQKCGIPYFVANSLGQLNIEDHIGAQIDAKSKALLKAMFNHSRLWASIWDGFLAPNAPMASDWVEIQMFDAKLLAMREQHVDNLSWSPEAVEGSTSNASSEPEDRRRLLVFLVGLQPDERALRD